VKHSKSAWNVYLVHAAKLCPMDIPEIGNQDITVLLRLRKVLFQITRVLQKIHWTQYVEVYKLHNSSVGT